ncbi:hypothetical protein AWL63_17985 [Sphingomonas panacis]|uniref:Uncharacterized protein n=1 Tax=Sphingomonas panacis TaxID=1560345 RepID=A0A1B3ZDQ2_9SPHN|nr:hypothetical protein [Sphingomonas panacis]AOH85546.1 hypothetical protein AWL63_17985 [Sphingomonas panacis]
MNPPLFLLLAATPIAGLPLDVLPKQDLPATGCAAFLWTATEQRTLVAMAAAEPAHLRVSLDGAIVDLSRSAQRGATNFGLSDSTDYAAPGIRATLDLTIQTRADLVKGAAIPDGALRIDRDGKDGVVVPVTGLVGCSG